MSAPGRDIPNYTFPRMFVRDAFYPLRRDLPEAQIDAFIEDCIARLLALPGILPPDAFRD
jgi:hypothetical protein